MLKLEIRSKHLATRCEICHQSDFFDPETNICDRCQSAFFSPIKPREDIDSIKNSLKEISSHISSVHLELKKHQKNHIDGVFALDNLLTKISNKIMEFVDNLDNKLRQIDAKIFWSLFIVFLLNPLVLIFIYVHYINIF
jgi:hypothetical protein